MDPDPFRKTSIKDFLSERIQVGCVPKARVIPHSSQIFKKSIDYRLSSIWNQLPREWNLFYMCYNKFKILVKDWIIDRQKDEYKYY